MRVIAVGRSELEPYAMPARFRHDIAYFMTPAGSPGVPALAAGEYWIRADDARHWLDEGILRLVSPLDSQNQAEVELTEEQEGWLEWLIEHGIERVRLEA